MAARAYDCLQGDLGASGNQQIRLSTQQFSRADKWAARIIDGAIFNDNVLSFAKTVLFQLRRKRPIVLDLRRWCGPGREILLGGLFQLAVREHETATSVPRCRQQDR